MDKRDDDDRFTLAIFPVSQYLADAELRQAVIGLTGSGRSNIEPADAQALVRFHPLSPTALKEKREMDAYVLIGMYGTLVRTHVVVTNGSARTNPPPDDYACDSCHTKGWLKKDYQDSKLDGANIPVWLCPDCSKLKPEGRDIRF